MRTPLPVANKAAEGTAARELVKSEERLPLLKAKRALFKSNAVAEAFGGV
jgi:hypothetical protein